jgi:hypothetical protein
VTGDPLEQSPAVRQAMARLAGRKGKLSRPKPADDMEKAYLAQTGRAELTPAQRRNVEKRRRREQRRQ